MLFYEPMKTSINNTLAFGITGGIGSGKSEACKIFARLGAALLYADNLAKEIIDTNPAVKRRIQKVFGDDVYLHDGTLDRKRMAKLVFQDEKVKEQLNAIVHPVVLDHIRDTIKKTKSENKIRILIVEAALIFEAKADAMFDYVIVVDAPEEERINRVMIRDNISRTEVLGRIRAQMNTQDKVAKADFVIQNGGDKTTLEKNCQFLFR